MQCPKCGNPIEASDLFCGECGTKLSHQTNTTNETKIEIVKKDAETEKPLQGAKFNILDASGNIVYSDITTNEEGLAVIDKVLPGKYYIQEIKAPEGYELSKSNIEVEITNAEREVDLTATNLLKLELPETGSIGLAIFTVAGKKVMSVAFILKKKKKVQE